MSQRTQSHDAVPAEIDQLRAQNHRLLAELEEAREVLRAIREGEIDALVVTAPAGERVFTLQSAEQPYRLLVEQMREGAMTLVMEGTIYYANRALAEMLQRPLERVIGSSLREYVVETDQPLLNSLMQQGLSGSARGELSLIRDDGTLLPAYLSLSRLASSDDTTSICMVVTNLTEQRRSDKILASERYARGILNQAADAIVVCDAQGQVTFANAGARQYAQEELVGANLEDFSRIWGVGYDAAGQIIATKDLALAKALRGQSTVGRESRRVRDDGTFYHVLGSASPLRDADGSIIGAVATFTDITERKDSEQKLQQQLEEMHALEEEQRAQNQQLVEAQQGILSERQRYEDLFQSAPDGYLVSDGQGQIIEANRAAGELLETTAAALKRQSLDAFVEPEMNMAFWERMNHARQTGHRQEWQTRLKTARGTIFDAMLTVVAAGEGGRLRWLVRDISPQKRLEADLQQARDAAERSARQAETASKAKDHFLAVLSHELRTPLTPVLATAQMMEADPELPAEARESAAMICRNVALETQLIDDLLDLTRISRNKLGLRLAPRDIHRKLHNVVQMCQAEIEAKELKLSFHLQATAHQVRADSARMEQVLWNLLKNAIKFTSVGGTITLRTENPAPDRVRVQVIDNGVGIEPEIMPLIFNAFEQGGTSITRQFGGLGLGLTISKALVELHGGTLIAQSDGKDRGATFTLELPTVVGKESPEHVAQLGGGPNWREKCCRILLVEDHGDTAKAMARLLRSRGHRVQVAGGVASALAAAQREPFDLLVSDLGLPDGSGLDLMRQLRTSQRVQGVALSGYGMEEDIRKSKEAGFAEHLTKPVNIDQLHETIQRLARESHPAEEQKAGGS